MSETTPRRPLQFTLRALLLLTLAVAAALACWAWLRGRPCSLPARCDIAAINVTGEFWAFQGNRKIPAFEIPEKHWDAVLAALTPCRPDPSPSKWMCLCTLAVHTTDGRDYVVDLFWLEGAQVGAFRVALEGDHPQRTYYRGGNSVRLRDAIVAAYDESNEAGGTENSEAR